MGSEARAVDILVACWFSGLGRGNERGDQSPARADCPQHRGGQLVEDVSLVQRADKRVLDPGSPGPDPHETGLGVGGGGQITGLLIPFKANRSKSS